MPNRKSDAAAIVDELKKRLERQLRSVLECVHQRQADQCDLCKGKTASGLAMEAILEELRGQGLIDVEAVVEIREGNGQPVRHRRNLKKLVGLGIGASFFIGLVGWQGGKLIWRLIEKKKR